MYVYLYFHNTWHGFRCRNSCRYVYDERLSIYKLLISTEFFFSKKFFQFWSHQLKGRFDSQIASDDDPNPNDGFKCYCTDDYSQTCPQHFRSPFVFLKKGAFFKVGDWNNSGITMSNLGMFDEWIFNLRISSNFFPHFFCAGYSLPRGSPRPPGILNRSGIFGAVAFGDAGAKCWSFHMGISWWFSWLL